MRYKPISSNEIFKDLCVKIRKLELEPGSMISENEIAELYNVSRSKIRTAFSKLEQINLIKRYPQIGTFVNTFDLSYIRDALYIRNLVEMDVIEKVINLEDKTDLLNKLEENLKLQELFRNKKNYEDDFKDIDADFHNSILESVGKHEVMDIIHDSFIHIARWKYFDIQFRNRINMLIDDHNQLFNSIKNNDIIIAKETMCRHLINMDDSFINQAKKEFPNYF